MSIQHKVQGIVAVACAAALLAASAVFTIYDRATFMHSKTAALAASAQMIDDNSTAALLFHDANAAHEILSVMKAQRDVVHGCIYDSRGKVFTSYSREAADSDFCPLPHQAGAADRDI